MATTQELKDSAVDAQRPYTTADERTNSLRGLVGLGRQQPQTPPPPSPQSPDAQERNASANPQDIPPGGFVDAGYAGGGRVVPGFNDDVQKVPQAAPDWPADIRHSDRRGLDPLMGGLGHEQDRMFLSSDQLSKKALAGMPPAIQAAFKDRHIGRPEDTSSIYGMPPRSMNTGGFYDNGSINLGRGVEQNSGEQDAINGTRHEILHAIQFEGKGFMEDTNAGSPKLIAAMQESAAGLMANPQTRKFGEKAVTEMQSDPIHMFTTLAELYIKGVPLPPPLMAYFAPIQSYQPATPTTAPIDFHSNTPIWARGKSEDYLKGLQRGGSDQVLDNTPDHLGPSVSQSKGNMGMPAADRPTAEFDTFGRLLDPVADAKGIQASRDFWSNAAAKIGNAPVISQVGQFLEASRNLTQGGLGMLDALDPTHREAYYGYVGSRSKALGKPPDDPDVMWQAAQDLWLHQAEPFPMAKGLLEAFLDPSNLLFVGAGEAVGAVRGAGGVGAVAGKAGEAIAEAGPKAAGSFAESMGVRVPKRVTAYRDSEDVLRMQAAADRLKAIGQDTSGLEADLAALRGQAAETEVAGGLTGRIGGKGSQGVKGEGAGPRSAQTVSNEQLAREADIRAGKAAPSDVVPGEAPKMDAKPAQPIKKTGRLNLPSDPGTPFEAGGSRTGAAIRASEGKADLVMPTIENLGLPTQMVRDASPEVRDLLEQVARDNYQAVQEQRRGALTVDQLRSWGHDIGIDINVLDQVKPGSALTPEGVSALKGALEATVEKRLALEDEIRQANVAGAASSEQKARLAVKVYEQFAIQKALAGGRAEWGRVGVMLREITTSSQGGRVEDFYARILKAVGGEKNIDKITEALNNIRTDPGILSDLERNARTLKYISGLGKATNWEKLDEAYINALLSNPHTHAAYVTAQLALRVMQDISAPGVAGIEALKKAVTFGRYQRQMTFTGALGRWVGEKQGISDGLQAGWLALRTGMTRADVEAFGMSGAMRTRALEGSAGAVLTGPSRLVNTYTAFFHEWGRTASLHEQAFDIVAKRDGVKLWSKDFFSQVHDLINEPTMEMEKLAKTEGKSASLRGDPKNAVATWFKTGRDLEIPGKVPVFGGFKPLRRIEPFIDITFNIAAKGVEYSPFGILRAPFIRGKAQSEAVAHSAMGMAVWAYFWQAASEDRLTGAEPSDPNERAAFLREGKRGYSIKFGNEWFDYSKFEPVTFAPKWVWGFHEALKNGIDPSNKDAMATAASKMAATMGQGVFDGNFMIGISQLVQMKQQADRGDLSGALSNYAGKQLVSQIPFSSLLRTTAQSVDPYVRSPRGLAQQVEAVIPGLSAILPASMTVYGEPNKRAPSEQGISGVVNPFRGVPSTPDPVDAELAKHKIPPVDPTNPNSAGRAIFATMAQQDIASFKLTAEEGRMLQTSAGRATHAQLDALFNGTTPYDGKSFNLLTEAEKVAAIQKTMRDARATARAVVADTILQGATTAPEIARAADMRLSQVTARHDRALFLEGLSLQGKMNPQVSALLNDKLNPPGKKATSPTVAEYLKAAPLVRSYLAAPLFDQGNAQEWKALEAATKKHSDLSARDKLDGTKKAEAFLQTSEGRLIAKYSGIARSRERQRILDANPWLAPFLGGTKYVAGQ
jgi:hypothetical protein